MNRHPDESEQNQDATRRNVNSHLPSLNWIIVYLFSTWTGWATCCVRSSSLILTSISGMQRAHMVVIPQPITRLHVWNKMKEGHFPTLCCSHCQRGDWEFWESQSRPLTLSPFLRESLQYIYPGRISSIVQKPQESQNQKAFGFPAERHFETQISFWSFGIVKREAGLLFNRIKMEDYHLFPLLFIFLQEKKRQKPTKWWSFY